MKKLFSVLLVAVLVSLLCLPLVSCSPKIDYDYAFITDLHVVANSTFTQENYQFYTKKQKLTHISEAILHSLIDELIDRKYKYVLVGGDITEYGDEASHLVAAAAFKRLQESGCKVFVINGNHDLPYNKSEVGKKISPTQFKEIYKDFGYEQAIELSPITLGYTANLNKHYRVIAVDNMPHYGPAEVDDKPDVMSDANIRWVQSQVDNCAKDGVTPIIFAHDTMINHYPPIAQVAMSRTATKQFLKLMNNVADSGAQLVFAGHDHIHDINVVETDKGNKIYEAATAAMVIYPLAYREMSFTKKKAIINTRSFDKLNLDYLPEVCPDHIREELSQGLQTYCYNHFYNYIHDLVLAAPDMVKGFDLSGDAARVVDILADGVVEQIAVNPFYIKDETKGVSLERILQPYGIALPPSDYKNLAELAPHMVMKLLAGDENLVGAPELDLVKYTVFSVFYYYQQQRDALAEVYPNYVIDIDLDKMFSQGILECYDSNLVPFGIKLAGSISSAADLALGLFTKNFDEMGSESIKTLLSNVTSGIVTNLDDYFVGKDFLIDDFIEKGVWGIYAKEYVQDNPPPDSYFEIEWSK